MLGGTVRALREPLKTDPSAALRSAAENLMVSGSHSEP